MSHQKILFVDGKFSILRNSDTFAGFGVKIATPLREKVENVRPARREKPSLLLFFYIF